jgi:ABC-type branched-subunit amino acid transport system substrate-binding protein
MGVLAGRAEDEGEALNSSPVTAALTLSLTGPFARHGIDAAEGVRLWAEDAGIRLTLVDDEGTSQNAVRAYTACADSVDLLIGPFASGLVRAVAPVIRSAGRLLWNHGGAADDLTQPDVVSLPAPASSYFHDAVDAATACETRGLAIVQGTGSFTRAVADGAMAYGAEVGFSDDPDDPFAIPTTTVDASRWTGEGPANEELWLAGAYLLAGRFEEDIAVVRRFRRQRRPPPLLAAVAAGIPAFGQQLGEGADGVLGPVQWWPTPHTPEIGPSGVEFATRYQQRTGREPSYVAAQAAATGYLAHAAYRRGLTAEDIRRWRTSTMLGRFSLDANWRQVGHRVSTIQWQQGRMIPVTPQRYEMGVDMYGNYVPCEVYAPRPRTTDSRPA